MKQVEQRESPDHEQVSYEQKTAHPHSEREADGNTEFEDQTFRTGLRTAYWAPC